MEKADFKINIPQDKLAQMEQQTRELKAKLKSNPQIASLIERGDINQACIEQYPWKLNAWLKDFEPCIGCKGLAFCRQKTKGYFSAVKYDGVMQKYKKACKYMRAKEEAEAHMQMYLVNDLPETMRTISLEGLNADNEADSYIACASTLLNDSVENQSVYLYGNMGTGKTYLAAGACNDHAKAGEHVAFIHYPSFCARMAATFKDDEYKHELDRLKFVKFLVIDDIGAENVTEWNRDSILMPLLNAREAEKLPTWFTSNCDLEVLKAHFAFSSRGAEDQLKAERILERIETMCKVQVLTGRDRRK